MTVPRPAAPSLRVAVIGGGTSCEHDVSLASAAGIAEALATAGHVPVRLTIDRAGEWRDHGGRPLGLTGAVAVLRSCAVVVPAVHGPGGEDGTLAALADLAGVPCVGSGVGAGALAMDKWATKLVAEAVGVAVAPGVLHRTGDPLPAVAGPVVVKPVRAGSSHGVTLVPAPADPADPGHRAALASALAAAHALDDRVLVEDVVVGREIDVAVLARPDGSRVVAPLLEVAGVVAAGGIFDLATKYDGTADLRVPADVTPADRAALEAAAVAVFDALGCAGVARVDFFLTADGPVLNEVNTMPGFTEHSQVPLMFAAAGTAYADLLDLLVRDALAACPVPLPVPA